MICGTVYYLETTDPAYVVRVPTVGGVDALAAIAIVENDLPSGAFDLVSPLTRAALTEARYTAKARGLRLVRPNLVATRRE